MEPTYRDDDATDPLAVPGVAPKLESDSSAAAVALVIDGEMFEVRPDEYGGTSYTWLTDPNDGYGFGSNPTPTASLPATRPWPTAKHSRSSFHPVTTWDPRHSARVLPLRDAVHVAAGSSAA